MSRRTGRTAWLAVWLAVSVAALVSVFAGAAPVVAGSGVADPVYVFYPRGSCREDLIELEVWDRDARAWRAHPRHPTVPVESCQLEDAGQLLQELRWRCVETRPAELPPAWVEGLQVFDPQVMERCAVDRPAPSQNDAMIHVSSPAPGETVRNETQLATLEGSVRIAGRDGAEYDVVIALDVSRRTGRSSGGLDLIGAEVAAARSFLEQIRPRLGDVRIGLVTFPNLQVSRDDPGGTGARRDLPISADAGQLERALRAVEARGAGSFPSFAPGFDFALKELLAENPGSGARRDARKVLLIAADGRAEVPFGPEAGRLQGFLERFTRTSLRAQRAGVEVHLFALAGLAEEAPAFVTEPSGIAGPPPSFLRVLQPELGSAFFGLVSLPYVREVRVVDGRSGKDAQNLRVGADGRFSAQVPVERGPNPVRITALISDGQRSEREVVVEFDDSLIRERLLEVERERMRRVRETRGRVEIELDSERRRR